jgi:pantoate--beta-alanine ligase
LKHAKIIKSINALTHQLSALRHQGRAIGFVPTMGYLHEGHLSLVRTAKKENDVVVVSIFVNPLQFGPREDFHKYPRDLKRDARLLKGLCDIVFVPAAAEFYPKDFCSFVEVKSLSDEACGKSRPGHFIGVTTAVAKLFHLVTPRVAYFGQKDAQQAVLIQKMAHDLNFGIQVKVLPTVREKDGLAMSSRNVYLSPKERGDAVVLFQALKSAERLVTSGVRDAAKIRKALLDFINRTPQAAIDYIEIVDRRTFKPLKTIEKEAFLLLAVYIGSTRLIDNTILRAR